MSTTEEQSVIEPLKLTVKAVGIVFDADGNEIGRSPVTLTGEASSPEHAKQIAAELGTTYTDEE